MKKYVIKLLLVIISISFSADLYAQEYDDNGNEIKEFPFQLKGLEYGFNIGAYIPNNKVASFYNGEGNLLSLYNAINTYYVTNYSNGFNVYNTNYQNIKNTVFNGDSFRIYSYPLKMKYSVAANIGFHARYNFTNRFGMYIEFNYSKLKAQGTCSLMDLNGRSLQEPYYFNLLATETRVDMNLGITKSFGKPGRFMPYAEAAFNLNNTTVLTADALIGGNSYSYLNPYYEYYGLRYGGIGDGGLVGGGIQVIASPTIIMNAGVNFSLRKIHLGDNSAYSLNTILYIRLLFYKLISTKPEA